MKQQEIHWTKYRMKAPYEYIKQLADEQGTGSQYSAAKILGMAQPSIYRYKKGRTMSASLAARIAVLLGIDPLEVIASSEFHKSKDEVEKAMWAAIWQEAAKKAAAGKHSAIALAATALPFIEGHQCILCSIGAESGNTESSTPIAA